MNYQQTNIFITYLPGAGGNFFSRCLNLLDTAYCWANKETNQIPDTLDKKLQLLTYDSVLNKSFPEVDWVTFEFQKICHYSEIRPRPILTDGVYVIWPSHNKPLETLQKPANKNIKLYLDVSEVYEWCIMNCIYKNTAILPWSLRQDVEQLQDNSIHKVNVKKIISGVDQFIEEIQKVCTMFNHTLSNAELVAITFLYSQWQKTMLPIDKINDFKKTIGWRL